jgi:Kef-type K+ transport system membrane component KefB
MELFSEITLVLLVATAVSFVMRFLKQPLIVGYILTGILVGPAALNLLHAQDTIELFSKLGITILLFIVGLHMSPKIVKEIGSVSLITGVGQVVFTSIIGFAIALYLGIDRLAAVYVAIALTFSSTIIILKLLSDKGAVQTLYGKIAIGFLLVQDVIATVILIVISSISTGGDQPLVLSLALTLAKGAGLLLALFVVTKWVLPRVSSFASKSSELLFLFSLTWGLGVAVSFYLFGLSIEIGALVAGVALSASAYADEISSRLRPLRDFFIIIFFIFLGAHMILDSVAAIAVPALILSLFVLVGNPIIVIILMNLLGYHRKTGFMAGLAVAQISEFSLILATLGMQVGHISQEVLTLITLVGLITIAGSTYLILYSERIYPVISTFLRFLELKKTSKNSTSATAKYDVFLFGFNRAGQDFLELFKDQGHKIAVVDFDPTTADRLPKRGITHFYGDAGNVEFLDELPLKTTKLVISSIPEMSTNVLVLRHLKTINPTVATIVFSQSKQDALKLYEAGADYVVVPHHMAAKHITQLISRVGFSIESFSRKQDLHRRELLERFA